jgi:hypothetical protein
MEKVLEEIARRVLGFDDLETKNSDRLDFKSPGVERESSPGGSLRRRVAGRPECTAEVSAPRR